MNLVRRVKLLYILVPHVCARLLLRCGANVPLGFFVVMGGRGGAMAMTRHKPNPALLSHYSAATVLLYTRKYIPSNLTL